MEVGMLGWCPSCGGIGTKIVSGVVLGCGCCGGSGKSPQ